MVWQDILISVASIIFSVALIPQVYHGFKKKIGPIKLQTSVPTFIGLYAISITYFTLSLNFSAVICLLTGTIWLILSIQKLIYGREQTLPNQIKIGVGVLVFKDGKLLLGKRKAAHGAGEYSGPGGHVEYMESWLDAAKREVKEETGLEITNIKFNCLINLKKYAPRHYVDIGLIADWVGGEPQNLEPNKKANWHWYNLDDLPKPLFGPTPIYLEAYKTGNKFYDE